MYLDSRLGKEEYVHSIYQATMLNEGALSILNRENDRLVEGELPAPMVNFRNVCFPHLIDGYRKQLGYLGQENATRMSA